MRDMAASEVDVLRCRECGALDPGPREFCAACGQAQLESCKVPGEGRLVSWTVIRRPPTRFKALGPYTIAIVDLDAGVRLTGRLAGIPDGLAPGSGVHFVGMSDTTYLFEENSA
jgi:uncharacterized OB-fold protein